MAEDTPQAFSKRFSPTVFAGSLLLTVMIVHTSQADAQTTEGTVRIVPAITSVAAEHGPFTVSIVLEDLEHVGTVQYDDDRDTEPDREVESIGLGAFEFTIEYDPAVLAVAAVERGADLERTGRTFQCLAPLAEPGSLSFGCLSLGPEPAGPQGTITLAEVTFDPASPGSSFLLLEAELVGPLGTDGVRVEVRPGAVRVTGRPAATATLAVPSVVGTATPSPQPGGASVSTPSPAGTPVVSTNPTASERDQTPQAPTAAAPEGDGRPKELSVREQDPETEQGRSAAGGRSRSSIALWSAAALAGLAAAVTLGLTAVRWQRRRYRPGE